jgi:hypothetical protein
MDNRIAEQLRQFALYGCVPRCLIRLAELKFGIAISIPDFVAKYAPKYWNTGDRCGLVDEAAIRQMASDLGLGLPSFLTSDFAFAKKAASSATGVLLVTRKPTQHCRLVTEWLPGDLIVAWSPMQHGIDVATLDVLTPERRAADGAEFCVILPPQLPIAQGTEPQENPVVVPTPPRPPRNRGSCDQASARTPPGSADC